MELVFNYKELRELYDLKIVTDTYDEPIMIKTVEFYHRDEMELLIHKIGYSGSLSVRNIEMLFTELDRVSS